MALFHSSHMLTRQLAASDFIDAITRSEVASRFCDEWKMLIRDGFAGNSFW